MDLFFYIQNQKFFMPLKDFFLIKNWFSKNIKILCADYEAQYMSQEFQQFLQSKGMIS